MFDEPLKLVLGLVTGILFGIFLQKGQVAKFQVLMGQFLLKNFTVMKIMATAIAVGTVGVHALVSMGLAELHIQTASLARVIVGGMLFGTGLAIFGLCPGTSVVACGEGRRDAMIGVLGMFVGAGVYVAAFEALEPLVNSMADYGKVTLPQLTSTSPWLWVGALVAFLFIALAIFERHQLKQKNAQL
jgi:uncharacterized membrane protein YedE/YeeE